MRATRCRFFFSDGTPFRGGCPNPDCQFVHPDDKDRWDDLPPLKDNVRCKHFKANGTVKSYGCLHSSRECRFVHPDDPKWQDAEPSKLAQARGDRSVVPPPYIPMSSVPSASRTLRDVSAPNPRTARNNISYAARPALPRIHTDTLEDGQDNASTRPSIRLEISPGTENPNNLLTPESGMNTSVTPLRSSPSESLAPRVPFRDPILSPEDPGSAPSFSIESDQRLLWKKRLSLLTQVLSLRLELSDLDANFEKRQALQSVDFASVMAPSARDKLQGLPRSSEENPNGKILEEKLEPLITQLIESDIWPLPTPTEPVAQLGAGWCFDRWAALFHRLDEAESQLKTDASLDTLAGYSGTVTAPVTVLDDNYTKPNDPSPRPLKRSRTSRTGSVMRSSNLMAITERLDNVEQRAIELEADSLHGEHLGELIEDVIEAKIHTSDLLEGHEQSGHNKLFSEAALDHRPLLETLGSTIQSLNSELDAYCVEQAENVSTSGQLEVNLGNIRAETGTIKESVAQLEAGQRSLREKQDDVDRQIRDLEKEMITLRSIPHFDDTLVKARTRLASAMGKDVGDFVNASREQLESSINTRHSEMVRSVLTSVEPTLLVTEYIYESMARHFEEGRGPLELAEET